MIINRRWQGVGRKDKGEEAGDKGRERISLMKQQQNANK